MIQPGSAAVHINTAMSDLVIGMLNAPGAFMAPQAFSITPVDHISDYFYVWNKDDLLRDDAILVGDATTVPDTNIGLGNDTYACLPYKVGHKMPGRTWRNMDGTLRGDKAISAIIAGKINQLIERVFVQKAFATSLWGSDVTISTKWNAAGSSPRTDVQAGMAFMTRTTGQQPNVLALGYEVFLALQNNAEIKAQFQYTSSESITADMLATYFGVKRVVVSSATRNTAIKGATANYAFYAGKNALLLHRADLDSDGQDGLPFVPEAGKIFAFRGNDANAGADEGAADGRIIRVRSDYNKELDYYWWDATADFDLKVTGSSLGYFMNAAIS